MLGWSKSVTVFFQKMALVALFSISFKAMLLDCISTYLKKNIKTGDFWVAILLLKIKK